MLTEVLLKHDFNLDVKIPPNKLVPTLPLRLNYILWIEDLINHASFDGMEGMLGIDIGNKMKIMIDGQYLKISIRTSNWSL